MYRRLLLLQRVFEHVEPDELDGTADGDRTHHLSLCAAIKEVLNELTEHAGILMTAPFPIGEWRPGDGPDDERWRALTEIERREVLALMSAFESLIAWTEAAYGDRESHLQLQRIQLGRARKELSFLERRRGDGCR